jgi:hypothetical protein
MKNKIPIKKAKTMLVGVVETPRIRPFVEVNNSSPWALPYIAVRISMFKTSETAISIRVKAAEAIMRITFDNWVLYASPNDITITNRSNTELTPSAMGSNRIRYMVTM